MPWTPPSQSGALLDQLEQWLRRDNDQHFSFRNLTFMRFSVVHDWSQQRIAKELGRSHQRVGKVLAKIQRVLQPYLSR
ncbi:hypothetical protein [Hymenobacter jejuensis]|uniref:RNA polymerase sigma-70 region 4 domain-containing protein n=1 Tax=Hymenobacter jejuensis TaxID=2502781 RepID=A0A5B7ZW09_9BACT|nr:hypothetical protein [Hymenobacter jejuensis]QDA59009.1 hypothetical protein FHG12_02335 [Hymenobacter jejuensis]